MNMSKTAKTDERNSKPWEHHFALLSLIVSAIAVVLSQLPPIHTLFQRSRLEALPADIVTLEEAFGYPYFQWFIQFRNSGKAPGIIGRVELALVDAKSMTVTRRLPADMYVPPPNGPDPAMTPIILGDITVAAFGSWENVLLFNPQQDPADQRQFRMFLARTNHTEDEIQRLVDSALTNLTKRLRPTSYYLVMVAHDKSSDQSVIIKTFRLEILNSDLEFVQDRVRDKLRDILKGNRPTAPVPLILHLSPVQDKALRRRLEKLATD
jgi:hypothetical protein